MRFLNQSSTKLLTGIALFVASHSSYAQAQRNVDQYNLQEGVGLHGFDPVAVFPEGGSQALKGQDLFESVYKGVTYYFANEQNKSTFDKDPKLYEPTYGGWCAYAMASGSKVDIQPDLFTIHGRRAHYFVSRRAKQNFDRDLFDYEARADAQWTLISGEDPRQ